MRLSVDAPTLSNPGSDRRSADQALWSAHRREAESGPGLTRGRSRLALPCHPKAGRSSDPGPCRDPRRLHERLHTACCESWIRQDLGPHVAAKRCCSPPSDPAAARCPETRPPSAAEVLPCPRHRVWLDRRGANPPIRGLRGEHVLGRADRVRKYAATTSSCRFLILLQWRSSHRDVLPS